MNLPETDTLLYQLNFERQNQPLYPEEALAVFKEWLIQQRKTFRDKNQPFHGCVVTKLLERIE